MKEGNRIRMDRPGPNTPVPVGTWGVSLGFSPENGWEIAWETGVSTFFPGSGDEVSAAAPEGQMSCDFCSSPDPRWEHRCHDSESVLIAVSAKDTQRFGQGSHGSWAACEACHRLIEADKPERLASRAARSMASEHGMPFALVLKGVREAHRMYWNHRVGPGFPIHQPAEPPRR